MGPALIDTLLPRATVLECAQALADGGEWLTQVQEALAHPSGVASQAALCDQATRVLQALSRSHPVLLILDDLQWADRASINLLFHLARQLAGQRILLLGAYRPEEVAAGRDGRVHPLQPVLYELQALWAESLVDLGLAEGRAFVEALVDSEPNDLGPAFREALYRHTGGHALFSVELLRAMRQRGDLMRDRAGHWVAGPALDWRRLPPRVEAVIAAQIARLPREDQALLTVASVEGVEFHAEVAARVLECGEAAVMAALSGALSRDHRLVTAHSLRIRGEQPFSGYRFRHELFQRYLYERLDPVHRGRLHGEVAGALEALGAAPIGAPDWTDTTAALSDNFDDLQGAPESIVSEVQLAWHWEEAGLAEKAALCRMRANRRIQQLSFAYEETLTHATKALELLGTLSESPERARQEIVAYYGLGCAWGGIKSYMAPEVGQAFRNMLELAEQLRDPLLTSTALVCLSFHHCERSEPDQALALNRRAVPLAQGGPAEWVLYVQGALAWTLVHRGDFSQAARLLEPLSAALLHSGTILPWSAHLKYLLEVPWAIWSMGHPDRALEIVRVAQQMMERESGRFGVGFDVVVLCDHTCFVRQLRREVEGVERGLQTMLPLIEQGRCPPWQLPLVDFFQGWVRAQRGGLEQGIAEMRQATADLAQIRLLRQPRYKGYLAEALAQAGRVDEGLALLDEALAQVERTNERSWEAELRRLQGELLLQRRDDPEVVEECYRQAIAVAQRQQARSWELRATTSLARLLRDQRRIAEAREALAATYGWFTEGFHTPDLVEA
ncbi:MAG: AAA family ATPase, partial [Anaerolineae bacterium]|nr:AAA family ATPase [Anaerolineae bacterium]